MSSSQQDKSTVAILFFSHVFDRTAIRHLNQLREESADYGTLFVYADVHGQDPPATGHEVVRFDFEAIRQRYPRVLGDALVPGNCHLTLLAFFQRYPQFQYYWVIEYDVKFAGDWRQLFDAFASQPADFVSTHLRHQGEEPDWYWWRTVEAPDPNAGSPDLIRAFCPIQRVSRRSLELLEKKTREGWAGHFECLVPTLISAQGYSLIDIGGDGRYAPPGFKNRFYTSFSWRDGSLLHFGSIRFRPPFVSVRDSSKNILYHPVKGPRGRPTAWSAWVPIGLEEKLVYIVRNLARHPVVFCRALGRLYRSRPSAR